MALSSVISTPIKSYVLNTSQSSLNSSQDSSFGSSRLDLSGYSTSPATTPVGRDNKAGWYGYHEQHKSLCRPPSVEYIMCGDSIIAGLSRYPNIWRKFFQPLRAINCGIGGDRTQHVLWRVENLDVSKSLKFVVIHCGTNNIDRDEPSCIANGILSIAATFQDKAPNCNVIVTGLLPRDLHPTYRRTKIKKVNKILKKTCRDEDEFKSIHYMRQDDDWVQDDGLLDESLYHTDHLHLIEKGNEKFATSITDALERIKEHGAMEYSSDDDSDSGDTEYSYHRQNAESRKRRFKDVSEDEDDRRSRSRSKKSRRSNDYHRRSSSSKKNKHRRHSSPPPRRRERSEEKKSRSSDSKNNWKVAREHGVSMLNEKKRKKSEENDELETPVKQNRTKVGDEKESPVKPKGPLSGTAKSIDISLDEQKRKEARKNKFAAPIKNPGALIMKIKESQQEARKDIDLKKQQMKKRVESQSSGGALAAAGNDEKLKKFFSDYTADSDSE